MGNELLSADRFLRRLTQGAPAGGRRLLAAVSGGLDSMCLLHFLLRWAPEHGGSVVAAHFNHRLRPGAADRDEAFVRAYCEAGGVPFLRGEGDTRALSKREGLTLEEAARKLRYAFLARAAAEGGCRWILTAHHADDNAETMLLNLCRGTGSRGLAGIPPVRGQVARPLLAIPRRELEDYAALHGIPHVEDETNRSDDAARNLLRHQVLPALRQVNPRAVENMGRAAGLLRGEEEALTEAALALSAAAWEVPGGVGISREALSSAHGAVAGRAALDLLERVCGHRRDLSAGSAEAVLALSRSGRGERRLSQGLLIRAEGDALLITRASPPPPPVSLRLGGSARFGDWLVTLGRERPEGPGECFALSLPAGADLTVTRWRGGDRLALPGSRGGRSFKRLCADRGIRPFRRDALPVLRAGEAPAAAPGLGVDARFLPEEGKETGFVLFQPIKKENSGYGKDRNASGYSQGALQRGGDRPAGPGDG